MFTKYCFNQIDPARRYTYPSLKTTKGGLSVFDSCKPMDSIVYTFKNISGSLYSILTTGNQTLNTN